MDQSPGSWAAQAPAPEKSSELYIRDFPVRSIAIVSASHALILRYSSTASDGAHNGSHSSLPSAKSRTPAGDASVSKCMVEFSPVSSRLLKDYRPLAPRPVFGTLGLIAVNGEVFLSVITHAVRTATVRPGETVERIASVAFYCLSSADYDDVVPLESTEPDLADAVSNYSANSPYGQGLSRRDVPMEHPCHDLRKLLSNGSFYYSTDFDLTNRLQDRPINTNSFDIDNFDDNFLWNSFMISPLVQFRSRLMPQEREALDSSRILTSAIRGFCKTMTLPQSAAPLKSKSGMPSFLTLISRLSCMRAGTRFNARGIDDDGHVANFVETETTFYSPSGTLFSYAQVRGSVPVFWEQAADLLPGRQKVTVTRSSEGTQPAFNKHFEDLEHTYGAVHIINLLSESKPAEVELSSIQPGADGSSDHALLRETHYDFHAETKGPAGYEAAREIRRYIEDSTDGFAYFLAQEAGDGPDGGDGRMVVVLQQEGVFRTNCLDCLDRTNLIQTLISQMAVEAFLGHRGDLWADNGDSLSKIYAGTGALKSSFTRHGKMSLAGAMADVRKSVQRIYHNNFVDPSRQITIDMLLGRLIGQSQVHLFDPISDFVSMELGKRSDEFTSFESISIWAGTFNLNGRTEGIDHDLSPWLFPPSLGSEQPDIYVVAFQEIVELSPQQIMNSDPSRKSLWEKAVKRALNQRQASLGGEKYVILRSGQLVGAALCLFVKTSILSNIKNVEGSVKKTGLSGMAGNKGAVAIRFDYANTHLCFVTAHLAAGFANYDERNRDYTTIHQGLRFQRNRGIEDHARALVKKRDLATLYENDQLNLQMVAGLAFPFYSEARIGFMPTYKFDLGTDTYDSSEKARIPAWTDRILRKGAILRQLSYDSAPLRFSDHRPVYATFECRVSIVNEERRESISQELYTRRKADVGDPTAHAEVGEESEDEDLIGYDSIEPGLPPASSDRQKWWLDNKQPARAQVSVPNGRDGQPMALNPNRPSNPFGHSDEPDWVSIPRGSPGASLSSISSSPYEKRYSEEAAAAVRCREAASQGRAHEVGRRAEHQKPTIRRIDDVERRATASASAQATSDSGRVEWVAAGHGHVGEDANVATLPTTPRPASVASSHTSQLSQQLKASSASGKSPPPVAKKPAHLATSSQGSKPPPMGEEGGFRPGVLTRASTTSSTQTGNVQQQAAGPQGGLDRKPVPGPGPRTTNGKAASQAHANGRGPAGFTGFNGSEGLNGQGPPLPARHGQGVDDGPVDLLDSVNEGGEDAMGGWETLQPSRAR
ncbi:hypothetical protein ACCO45_003273 [Purpureocillium lilacinum]|uniref:Uncharacterized protein n=1 Tax=Purpureocillium lilacinum TaxID=33203 RepID=A0ACC4DZE9_PURLI